MRRSDSGKRVRVAPPVVPHDGLCQFRSRDQVCIRRGTKLELLGRPVVLCDLHRTFVHEKVRVLGPEAIHWSRSKAERIEYLEGKLAFALSRMRDVEDPDWSSSEFAERDAEWAGVYDEVVDLEEYLLAVRDAPDRPFIALATRLRNEPGRKPAVGGSSSSRE